MDALDVHAALLRRGETLGCAESLTGGDLASLLSSTPGASGWFRGGVVSYATDVKRRLLGVRAPRVISADCAAGERLPRLHLECLCGGSEHSEGDQSDVRAPPQAYPGPLEVERCVVPRSSDIHLGLFLAHQWEVGRRVVHVTL